jgi:hemolysin III
VEEGETVNGTDRKDAAIDAAPHGLPTKPRLRGVIHSVSAPAAAIVAILLWRAAAPGLPRLSVAVFGLGLIGLFTTSGLYHLPRWPARIARQLARADVAMIQLFIAASFTPVAVHTLSGAWRTWSLVIAWTIAIVGAVIAASPLKGPRWLSVAAYSSFGALAAIPLLNIIDVLPLHGVLLILAGGAVYLVGGVVYALRAPDPWPSWFGFHEVFHVLVVAGGALHVTAIWRYALPLAA